MTTPDDSGTHATLAGQENTPDHQELPRGSNLGRYVIIEPIGSGGMGTVYRAYDPQLNRGVALKILSVKQEDQQAAERAKARLIREAQALAQLSHPNVVAVHDAGTFEDDVFIAMELVEGKTLDDWLKEEKRAVKEILGVMIAAGRGLSAAHKAGLIHRDFKPGNVMVGDDGRVRVLDFGLARAADHAELIEEVSEVSDQVDRPQESKDPFDMKEISSDSSPNLLQSPLTVAGGVLGTPMYMAPEQHLGLKTDERTDQFGFCVVLYEALYGRRPFAGRSMEELKREVIRQRVRVPGVGTDVPGWLWKIINKGLSARPEDRFEKIDLLLDYLDRDPEEVRRQKRIARRRNLFVASLILLTVALPIGVWYGLRYRTFQLCKAAEGEFEGVWDETTKVSIRQAFLRTKKSYAQGTWERTERVIDHYLNGWMRMRSDVCEARLIKGTQSEELFDLRMSCLNNRIGELRALVRVFVGADSGVVQKAIEASSSVTDTAICADEEALRAPYPPPKTTEDKEKIAVIHEKLAEVDALSKTGRYKTGLSLANQAFGLAKKIGYLPVLAETLYYLAELQGDNAQYKSATESFDEAALLAEQASYDVIRAKALVGLLWVSGYSLSRFDEAMELNRRVEAVVLRLKDNWKLKSDWLNNLGNVFWSENDFQQALDCYQRSMVIREDKQGPKHLSVAKSLNNIGNIFVQTGDYKNALHYHRRALEIKKHVLGQRHPSVALSLHNIGNVHVEMDDLVNAIEYYTEALALKENTLGPDHPQVASTLNGLGLVYRAMGNFDLSIKSHLRALAIREELLGPNHIRTSWVLAGLGWSYLRKRKFAESTSVFERALRICVSEKASTDTRCNLSRLGLGMALWQTTKNKERALDLLRKGLAALEDEPSKYARRLYSEALLFVKKQVEGS